MYAKLVVGSSNITGLGAARDIVRLCTSTAPSTADLGSFNAASSLIIDATPAGWSYVGGSTAADQPILANKTVTTATTLDQNWNLVMRAPTASNANVYKYAQFRWTHGVVNSYVFGLTGCSSATNLGVITNEGGLNYETNANGGIAEIISTSISVAATQVLHVIATPRHITIIDDTRGLAAIWETTQTDAHTFYGTAPFIQYSHCDSSSVTRGPTTPTAQTTTQSSSPIAVVFNLTNPVSAVNTGVYDVSQGANQNIGCLFQNIAGARVQTVNSVGTPRYVIEPVHFILTQAGYPRQFVTGIVPIYWASATMGNTGDTITIGSDVYTYFKCGTGFGVLMRYT